jgi:hypothetical protein
VFLARGTEYVNKSGAKRMGGAWCTAIMWPSPRPCRRYPAARAGLGARRGLGDGAWSPSRIGPRRGRYVESFGHHLVYFVWRITNETHRAVVATTTFRASTGSLAFIRKVPYKIQPNQFHTVLLYNRGTEPQTILFYHPIEVHVPQVLLGGHSAPNTVVLGESMSEHQVPL